MDVPEPSASIRFIHTADIHLDRALRGLTIDDNAPAELLTATRSALSRLVDFAIDEKIAFIIIAGDLYDSDWKDFQTGYFFIAEMARLKRAGIKVVLLYGNHDAEQDMTKKLSLPDNVHCFGSSKPESIFLEEFKVVLHGQSFRRAETVDNLASTYPAPVSDYINIGVLHTALQGRAPHASYAPCSIDELKNKGYQYWALGHVHGFQVLAENPWIVFPGSLQGLHINEPGAKGAVVVDIEAGVIGRPERLFVDVLRWATAEVDVAGAETQAEVATRVRTTLQSLVEKAEGRPICCRVVLVGRTPLHGELYAHGQQLRADIVGQTISVGQDRLFVEQVRVQTQPLLSTAEIAARGDAVAELQEILVQAAQDGSFLASLQSEFEVLLSKMPGEIWSQDVPGLLDIKEGRLAEIVISVTPGVVDKIQPRT